MSLSNKITNWLLNAWANLTGLPIPDTTESQKEKERNPMPRFMRGAKPSPRHRLAAAMPHVPTVTAPPQFLWHPTQLSIWGNDQFGDCTVAEEAFSKGASVGVFIPDEVVVAWARKHGAIEGDTLIDVLDKMKATGFVVEGKTFDDGQPLSIDWTNPTALQNAIAEGPVKIAVAANQLESAVPNPPISGWVATGFTEDQDFDHCVCLCGYGPAFWLAAELEAELPDGLDGSSAAYALFTWGTIGIIDEPSLLAICGEAWLRNPTTIVR